MRAPARVSRPLALRLSAWGVVLFGFFGCVDAAPLPTPVSPSSPLMCPAPPGEPVVPAGSGRTEAVIVVVLDGARWQDVLVGVDPSLDPRLVPSDLVGAERLMPHLHAMIAHGALVGAPNRGRPMVASGPNFVSLPGYNEIFGGRTAFLCKDNDCPQATLPTIVDEIRSMPPSPGDDAAAVSGDAGGIRRGGLLLVGADRARGHRRPGVRDVGALRVDRRAEERRLPRQS